MSRLSQLHPSYSRFLMHTAWYFLVFFTSLLESIHTRWFFDFQKPTIDRPFHKCFMKNQRECESLSIHLSHFVQFSQFFNELSWKHCENSRVCYSLNQSCSFRKKRKTYSSDEDTIVAGTLIIATTCCSKERQQLLEHTGLHPLRHFWTFLTERSSDDNFRNSVPSWCTYFFLLQ